MNGKLKAIRPTPEEDAEINRGIALDPDNPELDETFFREAKPASGVLLEPLRRRGPQKAPTKVAISIKLDRDLVERLRASGTGWQARVNDVLRKHA